MKTTFLKALNFRAKTFRSITVEGEELEFSEGFTDLHTITYQDILIGKGFKISETKKAIEIVHSIRV
ncbi:hypothetical protein [Nitritalea halalkaliphila]|uniref:hypothetical protein n=1 Tax=Nitritalea halalkaliphila TaxID=590849 RepID=UPI00030F8CC7|nr:hypothetical protein [Nitritalea halalkaliphila]